MHVLIMCFRKVVPMHLFVNGSLRCDSREGQVMGGYVFIDYFTELVDAGLVG